MGSKPWRGRWAPAYALLWSMVNFTFTFHLFLLEQAQTLHILQVFSDNPVLFRHHTALQPNQHYPYVETILIYLGKS